MPSKQYRYFALTIPYTSGWRPSADVIKDDLIYSKGQEEVGEGGYRHFQVAAVYSKKVTLTKAKSYFVPEAHLAPMASAAYEAYVWKEETRVAGSQFEYGQKKMKRNSETDWGKVYDSAKLGKFDEIPADIRVRCYHQVKSIAKDHMICMPRPGIEVMIRWGPPGTGKTICCEAWLGKDYYSKPAMNKWWDGYQGQNAVLIDDFDSQIGYTHFKAWFQPQKCHVESKNGALPLFATKFAITSNTDPLTWWPEANRVHVQAVMRRVTEVLYQPIFVAPPQPEPEQEGEQEDPIVPMSEEEVNDFVKLMYL